MTNGVVKKYTIRIERKETFYRDVEVLAYNVADAMRGVAEQYADGDFSGDRDLYFSPADVEDEVYCMKEEAC